ncbi:hypothetical protein EDC02_6930 [Micromonospora sp. Llam0]|nr:hypothetical protein EDC02_6930 [Micromonospora sp. Llam0]
MKQRREQERLRVGFLSRGSGQRAVGGVVIYGVTTLRWVEGSRRGVVAGAGAAQEPS